MMDLTADTPALWCVHVQGPDDVVPAPDRETAILWAERVNAVASAITARNPSRSDPLINAISAPWPHSTESHAEGVSDEYEWLLEKEKKGE